MAYTIEDVIDELFNKHNIPRVDISRMVKAQFKVTNQTIKVKGDKVCNLIFIGKFKPTPFRLKQLKQQKENE